MTTTQLLRATVQAPGLSGDDHSILVDGADTPVTAQGRPGYAPVAGDRVLVQKVGGQTKNIALDSGTQVITAGVFQTADNVGLGSAGGAPGMIMANDASGGIIQFFTGVANELLPGTINPLNTGAVSIQSPFVSAGPAQSFLRLGQRSVAISAGSSSGSDTLPLLTLSAGASGTVRCDSTLHVQSNDMTVDQRLIANQLEMDGPPTTASAANVFVGSGGLLNKVTSLSAMKLHQKALDPADAHAVLLVKPMTFYDKTQVEENPAGPGTEGLQRITGVIAEQVEEVAAHFALYDENGDLEGVDYRALSVALIDVVRNLEERVKALEKRVPRTIALP